MTRKLKAWIALFRLPFHLVGVFPFILGNSLVWRITGSLNWSILGWGVLAVAFILFSTHLSGEYFDYETDMLSGKLGKSKFSGGSQVLQKGIIQRKYALLASFAFLIPTMGIGMLLQFHYKTGYLTLPFGMLGIVGGLFYSMRPIQWSYRGLGEIWIGFCYGWLTIASSYYIQTGQIPALVHWTALPVAFSAFNVILINEFPDYPADKETGKLNLVVRFGKVKMSRLYALVSVATWISYILLVRVGIPVEALLFFCPVFLISLATVFQVLRGKYSDPGSLEGICAATLITNLGVSASLILSVCIL